MSLIKYSIGKVMQKIPKDILNLAFVKRASIYEIEPSLAKQIEDIVIDPIVKLDCDLLGGTEVTIPLTKCKVEYYNKNDEENNLIIYVPSKVVDDKKILSVLSLTYNASSGTHLSNNKEELETTLNKMINRNVSKMDIAHTGNCELIANNTILVKENITTLFNAYIKVTLPNDSNLKNIPKSSYLIFSKLVVLAVKKHIYNTLPMELDKGMLYSGQELSRINNEIDKYENSEEEYEDMLENKWSKISFMHDHNAMEDFFSSLIPDGG